MSDEANMQGHFYAEVVDTDDCTGCALCCQMCPDMAIEIKDCKVKTARPIIDYKTDKGSAKKVTVKGS
jgi:Pyruvate/2-oxoacid:ferredoxin oxidoreductase delta subunit